MFTVGECYYVRSVSDHWLGRLVSVDGPYTLTLTDFAWVSESGRLNEFLRLGHANQMEIEPAPSDMRITIQWLSVITWPHPLLRETV